MHLSGALTINSIATEAVIRTFHVRWLVIHAAGIIRILVDGAPVPVFGQELLHFPIVLLGSYREFEVFLRDRIPVLVKRLISH